MPSGSAIEQQSQSHRGWQNNALVLVFVGLAVMIGGVTLLAFGGSTVTAIGGILTGMAGLCTVAYGYQREHSERGEQQARQSAADLVQKLQSYSVHLSPEQQTAIQHYEYTRYKQEWAKKIEAKRDLVDPLVIGGVGGGSQ
jgi:hypothetical protein